MLEHVRWLLEEGEALGLPVVRVKNKFSSESSDEYDGYRSGHASLVLAGCVDHDGGEEDAASRVVGQTQWLTGT
eukprot:349656-Rhodomonas_salina.1